LPVERFDAYMMAGNGSECFNGWQDRFKPQYIVCVKQKNNNLLYAEQRFIICVGG
jgi:hypothetical protein